MPLFAQHVAQDPLPAAALPGWLIALMFLAPLLLFAGFALWAALRYAAKGRDLAHLERLRAIELGRPTEPPEGETAAQRYAHHAFWIAFWVGAGVPIAAVSCASAAMNRPAPPAVSVVLAVWLSATAISVAGVICATVLLVSSRQPPPPPKGERGPERTPTPAEDGFYEARRP